MNSQVKKELQKLYDASKFGRKQITGCLLAAAIMYVLISNATDDALAQEVVFSALGAVMILLFIRFMVFKVLLKISLTDPNRK